jgi:hypothetical protein
LLSEKAPFVWGPRVRGGVSGPFFPAAQEPRRPSGSAGSQFPDPPLEALRLGVDEARIVGTSTTIPPFEDATFQTPTILFFTPGKQAVRRRVNAWIRGGSGFDAVVDFDEAVPNDGGYVATGNLIPLSLFRRRRPRNRTSRGSMPFPDPRRN